MRHQVRKRGPALLASLAVVFGFTSLTRGQASAPDDSEIGPRVGTWQLKNKDLANKVFTTTFVIVRSDGEHFEGYIDWRHPGVPKNVEIISGSFDPGSRLVRLDVREMQTQLENITPDSIQGTLSRDGREIQRLSLQRTPTVPIGAATWIRAALPAAPSPLVSAAVELTNDRSRLYQQLSSNYTIQGVKIIHQADLLLLDRLAHSQDASIKDLTKALLNLRSHASSLHDSTRPKVGAAQKLKSEVNSLMLKSFLTPTVGLSDYIQNINAFMDSDVVKQTLDERAKATLFAAEKVVAFDAIRKSVQSEFNTFSPPRTAIDPRSFAPSFKVNRGGFGVISLRNGSGKDLHNGFIGARMKVDQAKMNRFEQEFKVSGRLPPDLEKALVVLDIGPDLSSAQTVDDATLVYDRVDKCGNAFIPEWKSGVAVEVEIARPSAIAAVGESITAWIGADEGTSEPSIPPDLFLRLSRASLTNPSPNPPRAETTTLTVPKPTPAPKKSKGRGLRPTP